MTERQQAYQRDSIHIYKAWQALGSPALRTICEVAVGPWSLLSRFEGQCNRALFIEPDPQMARDAEINFPWAQILRVAIAEQLGTANLRQLKGASYIKGIPWAPMFKKKFQARARAAGKIAVPTMPFNLVDDGEIDILNLDCEGSEWFVLVNLLSRPRIIQIELYPENHYAKQIKAWMQDNGYQSVGTWGRGNVIYQTSL